MVKERDICVVYHLGSVSVGIVASCEETKRGPLMKILLKRLPEMGISQQRPVNCAASLAPTVYRKKDGNSLITYRGIIHGDVSAPITTSRRLKGQTERCWMIRGAKY
ncbi:hypothetical protein Zmor_020011 [Zophobas morio]|uniref:Uncharacterized protein n=1 Tax=Zophobas morio TaxID=2755281 RepID=A0AA38I1W2_9CUCU|nr:hypothetical protein Zmor_020011 [Zophobas morio]